MPSPSGNSQWSQDADVVLPRLQAPATEATPASTAAPASESGEQTPAGGAPPGLGWSPTAWRRSG
jgi:hypothetical protein